MDPSSILSPRVDNQLGRTLVGSRATSTLPSSHPIGFKPPPTVEPRGISHTVPYVNLTNQDY